MKPLPDPGRAPADLAPPTSTARTVPLYVRHEHGVINRSVYEVSSIDATPGDEDPPDPAWNRRLVYRYGGGCGTTYGQGTPVTGTGDAGLLRRATRSPPRASTTSDVQCNDVLSAETTMMVKERVIEEFGVPEFDHRRGRRAAAPPSIHLLTQNYPGLIERRSWRAIRSPTCCPCGPASTDCGLLRTTTARPGQGAHRRTSARRSTGMPPSAPAQPGRTRGLGEHRPDRRLRSRHPRHRDLRPRAPTGAASAARSRTPTATSSAPTRPPVGPTGRSTTWACSTGWPRSTTGRSPSTQFLDLNERIGGYDLDGAITAEREEADPEARAARLRDRPGLDGRRRPVAAVPIIDIDLLRRPRGRHLDRFRAFSLRDRSPRRRRARVRARLPDLDRAHRDRPDPTPSPRSTSG